MKYTSKILFIFILLTTTTLSAALSASKYKFAEGNDIKIAYRTFGQGKPLVIINGGPGRSSDTFADLAEKLSSATRKVIIFDQRGTGKSQHQIIDEKTISLDLMVEDLESLRKHLKYKEISILGHSFGGMLAMAYAAKYPDNINALILSASGSMNLKHMKQVESNIQAKLSAKALEKYKFWTSPEQKKRDPIKAKLEVLKITAPLYIYNQKYVPQIEKNLTNLEYYNPKVNQLVWKSMKNFNVTTAFTKFKVPTLIMDGEQDFLGKEILQEIHSSIPNSRLEILKECSHYPWLDKPNEYFALINNFLAKL